MMPFVKATLISWPGKLRAGLDYFKKPYQLDENGMYPLVISSNTT